MPNGITASSTATTAEDDRVAVKAKVYGVSATGKAYDNQLFYAFEVHDGKIRFRSGIPRHHSRQ
jgi:ketosteroid isomerase-like protein